MQRLILRWTLWSSMLLFGALGTLGVARYLVPPEEQTPLDRLYRSAGFEEQDEAAVPRIAPEEIAFGISFSALWPTVLPAQAVLSDADAAARGRISFRWSDADSVDGSPLLRLDQEPMQRELPDRPEVTVRGLPGRLGPTTCVEQEIASRTGIEQDCLGVWWIEDGVSIALASPVLPASELLRIADSLMPLNLTRPVVYRKRLVHRIGLRSVNAGRARDYPIPSVTYLFNLKVYLVRTAVGFTALVDEDPHLLHRTAWNAERQAFISPAHGEMYTWLGRCLAGPCTRGLDRFAVSIAADTVIIDTTTRFMQLNEPYWRRPTLYLAPTWP